MNLETQNVLDVYSQIASRFDKTRYNKWTSVHKFIDSIPSHSYVVDLGCGNGKYLYRSDLSYTALDNCPEFIEIVRNKYPDVQTITADVTNTMLEENSYNACYSIAVIHHLSVVRRRKQLIDEIYRILVPGGIALITAWSSVHQERKILKKSTNLGNNDYLIPWENNLLRFYHLFEEGELESLLDDRFTLISSNFERDNWMISFKKN